MKIPPPAAATVRGEQERGIQMISLQPVIEQLENLFDHFNKHFFEGKLPKPVITVSPDDTSCGAYGWCTTFKIWADKAGAKEDEGYYEINLTSENLSRPYEAVAGTLLHEMVHLYNLEQKIQDCSRKGTYHNKKFRDAALAHGLKVEQTEKYGWSKTSLTDETKAYLDTLGITKFDLYRKPVPKFGKAASKSNSRKYVCPDCGAIVRATKEVHIICADCDTWFEEDTGEA